MEKNVKNPKKELAYLAFVNRENRKRHHYYDEEMKQYELMQAGDPAAVAESRRMMTGGLNGKLSDDPTRNMKYLFVANITIANRFAIEGGMDSETAYNTADLYIRRMDRCESAEEVLSLHHEMFTFFTEQMAELKKRDVFSRPVLQCMDYISLHLHEPIRLPALAEAVGRSTGYLSAVFKQETGLAVSDYIRKQRIETAKNMLLYSDYSEAEIGTFLAFSSQSYFIRCFRNETGKTPHTFRKEHFRKSLKAAASE